ncbi:nicotinate (nicotinamide) nucleotide adenylyltransferase [bacterium]|nr:nicotinate (nicotinamide) nucleotide adenylyltransferase [bacterium]
MPGGQERIGILGGSFNPPHLAHLLLAQEAWYRYELTRVTFIPAARNPFKPDAPDLATAEQRLRMVRLATEPDARFCVDAGEVRAGGTSYTVDTLRRLRKLHPEAELYLILGADAALGLPGWKEIEAYPGLCKVVVANRPGSSDLQGGFPPELLALGLWMEYMPLPPLELSASEIRSRIRMGKPVRYMVPDSVAEFIHEHGLYR